MYVDCHCHLTFDQFEGETDAVIERARKAGVSKMIVTGSVVDADKILSLAKKYPGVIYAAFGKGAGYVLSYDEGEALRNLLSEPAVVAIGEAGLDYVRDPNSGFGEEITFYAQAAYAAETDTPLVVHSRQAHADTLATLKNAGVVKGMIHSFSYGVEEAEQYLELGFHLSFSGMVCRSSYKHLKEVVQMTPIDRILTETDSPYLSPNPAKYHRNEPFLLPRIVKQIAKWKKMYPEEVAVETYKNAERLFGLI